ncbi:hypothetical protein NQ318_001718 [Aromia moschata]|uniref:Reverse transcriptase domain-containing protein n=1 Tax=Aromia moschata TaxID=1265417 RepID=A0AAV8XV42_9CUCU|nr:hypothetical protein NQ318_001718 [Aromia moschata]
MQYKGEYFQQHEGTAIGNSLSPFIANLFMSKFETEVKDKFEYFSRVWFRYADDIFAVFDTKAISLDNFVAKLNNRFPTIKFTYEMEHNEQQPFLDVLVIRNNENNEIYEVCKLINETGNVAPDPATLRRRDLEGRSMSSYLKDQRFTKVEDLYKYCGFGYLNYNPVCYDQLKLRQSWPEILHQDAGSGGAVVGTLSGSDYGFWIRFYKQIILKIA